MKQKVPFLVLKKDLRRAGFFYALRIDSLVFEICETAITKVLEKSASASGRVLDGNSLNRSLLLAFSALALQCQPPFTSTASFMFGLSRQDFFSKV